ncbi:hypothetical protein SLS55_010528 [Diplodia seriata]|uniref:Protein kinase domain-containing protein n=1 Tax=Diplodia seriata TaxID=420778 RepID=A0ABR3BXH1_9PEZI
MANARLDRELHQEFHDWIESQWMKGFGAPDLTANSVYVPQQRIDEYFKAGRNVGQILQRLNPDGNLKTYQSTIVKDYSRVLCILLLLGQGHQIEIFVRHTSLCDTRLPFEQKPAHFPVDDDGVDFFDRFKEVQWQFCAQPLTYNMNLVYEDARILPIMTKDPIGTGGSAQIFKITLHQAYDELDPHGGSEKKNPSSRHAHTYALKTYCTRDAKSYYANEISAFRRVLAAGSNQGFVPGLIGFHGNFIHGGTHNVLLEYADKGTLEQYFKEAPPPNTEDEIVSFWRGLFYPIFALLKIHNLEDQDLDNPNVFQGWHQDIKPENILVIGSGRASPYKYEFKLADLGLSHFKRPKSTTGEATDMDTYGTRTYGELRLPFAVCILAEVDPGAPESYRCDSLVGPANLRVSKSVDIWSLGCVYSEAATWLVLGKEGLEQYRADRRKETDSIPGFNESGCFHDGETFLKSVERTHAKIVATKRKTDHITRDVLQTLVQDMLGVETVRPNAQALWMKSQRLLKQAKGPRQSSMWSTSTESPTSSRAPTVQDIPPESQVGATVTFPTQPEHASVSRRGTRIDNSNFTGERKRLENSPERISEKTPDAASPSNTASLSEKQSSNGTSSLNGRSSTSKRNNPDVYWSVHDANLWKDTQRKRGLRSRSAPQGGETYTEMINKRDHVSTCKRRDQVQHSGVLTDNRQVFIVDDSNSMRAADWSKLTSRFSLLAYIVKKADDDGLDLYFSSSKKRNNSTKSSELTQIVQNRARGSMGPDNLSTVLQTVLKASRKTVFRTGGSKGFLGIGASPKKKPMTCYILTDGAWCLDKASDIETMIVDFVDELLRKDSEPTDFGIQFISFGNHQEGLANLERLDSQLNLKRDIVDTETADGNVWKMLLGSINKQFDEDEEEQSPDGFDRSASVRKSAHPYS